MLLLSLFRLMSGRAFLGPSHAWNFDPAALSHCEPPGETDSLNPNTGAFYAAAEVSSRAATFAAKRAKAVKKHRNRRPHIPFAALHRPPQLIRMGAANDARKG